MENILEEKIKKAVELIKKFQSENNELKKKIKSMTVELEALMSLREEKEKLKKEKEEAKKRVQGILNELEGVKL